MVGEFFKINLRYILCQFKDFIIKYDSFIFQNIQYYDINICIFVYPWVFITIFLNLKKKKTHFLASKSERKTTKSYLPTPYLSI